MKFKNINELKLVSVLFVILIISTIFSVATSLLVGSACDCYVETLQEPQHYYDTVVEQYVHIYENEHFTVHFSGFENTNDTEIFVFRVENSTDYRLTFQGDNLTINSENLGFVLGSDSVEAQSTGYVRFRTELRQDFENPETISGSLTAIEWSSELFDHSINFSFSNINLN